MLYRRFSNCTPRAPEVPASLAGNGELFGSLVASTITVSGNIAFHYDEALGSVSGGTVVILERLYWREPTLPRR